jgi:hypothetical protein
MVPGTEVVLSLIGFIVINMPQLSSTLNSPDSLPQKYSVDQLCAYIIRQLGSTVFAVEIQNQQIADCVMDALREYSTWRPMQRVGGLQLQSGIYAYLQGVDLGYGVVKCWFVNPTQAPADLYWLTNLVNPAPVLNSRMDEYDVFLRWYKTWGRVTSVYPDWMYDEPNRVLYIYNAQPIYQCGVMWLDVYSDTLKLDTFGAKWVKDYSFQKSRHAYAEIMSKYSGVIPGPIKDLQFDAQRRDKAEAEMDKLIQELKGAQWSAGMMQD